jgi:hypothetical protein
MAAQKMAMPWMMTMPIDNDDGNSMARNDDDRQTKMTTMTKITAQKWHCAWMMTMMMHNDDGN